MKKEIQNATHQKTAQSRGPRPSSICRQSFFTILSSFSFSFWTPQKEIFLYLLATNQGRSLADSGCSRQRWGFAGWRCRWRQCRQRAQAPQMRRHGRAHIRAPSSQAQGPALCFVCQTTSANRRDLSPQYKHQTMRKRNEKARIYGWIEKEGREKFRTESEQSRSREHN
jgi:hypothetical protein